MLRNYYWNFLIEHIRHTEKKDTSHRIYNLQLPSYLSKKIKHYKNNLNSPKETIILQSVSHFVNDNLERKLSKENINNHIYFVWNFGINTISFLFLKKQKIQTHQVSKEIGRLEDRGK